MQQTRRSFVMFSALIAVAALWLAAGQKLNAQEARVSVQGKGRRERVLPLGREPLSLVGILGTGAEAASVPTGLIAEWKREESWLTSLLLKITLR